MSAFTVLARGVASPALARAAPASSSAASSTTQPRLTISPRRPTTATVTASLSLTPSRTTRQRRRRNGALTCRAMAGDSDEDNIAAIEARLKFKKAKKPEAGPTSHIISDYI